mgnify:FL=1
MTIYQKLLYVSTSFAVALSVSMANYVFYDERLPDTPQVEGFYTDMQTQNDKLLKHFFPYEIIDYDLEVPENMSYTQAEFQKFKGTYLERESVAADESYLERIAFCGDSLTYHMGMSGNRLENYDVLAYGGLSVSDYATYTQNPVYNQSNVSGKTTIAWLSELRPEIVYLFLGANGMSIFDVNVHINLYKTLLNKIKAATPGSEIVLVSASPWGKNANPTYTSKDIKELNVRIDQFNMLLLELAKDNGCYFMNVAESMTDEEGYLLSSYDGGDGLHWSMAGRSNYVEYVLEHPIPGY